MRNVWKRVLVMTMTASLVLTGMPGRENRARAAGEGETKEVQQVELQTASGRDENYVKEHLSDEFDGEDLEKFIL